MKKVIISKKENALDYIISENDLPLCRGTYLIGGPVPGDIVEGIVTGRKPNVNGCFADIGEKRTAFFDDVSGKYKRGDRAFFYYQNRPCGTKGALLNVKLPFTGIYNALVLTPDRNAEGSSPEISISRKINDDVMREKLGEKAAELLKDFSVSGYSASLTVRTAASSDELSAARELSFMINDVRTFFSDNAERRPKLRILKRSFPEHLIENYRYNDYDSLVTNDPAEAQIFKNYFKLRGIDIRTTVLPKETEPFKTELSARRALSLSGRRIDLPDGGYVIYDRTEAMHVFDVNSGGSCGKLLDTDLTACEYIARYLSVNNLTGIIMIDFINVSETPDIERITERMRSELKKDYALNIIYGFTKLMILEMTRSRKLI